MQKTKDVNVEQMAHILTAISFDSGTNTYFFIEG